MTNLEQIKSRYDAGELTEQQAAARLEALGMWEDDAHEYLRTAAPFVHDKRCDGVE